MERRAPVSSSFSPMRLVVDTTSVAAPDQYAFWIGQTLGRASRWEVEQLDPAAGFCGRAYQGQVGEILLAEHLNDPFWVRRDATASTAADNAWYYLVTSNVPAYASGAIERRFAPDTLILIDARRPLTLHNSRFGCTRYAMIPASVLYPEHHDRPGTVRNPTAIAHDQPLGDMLHCHFRSLYDFAWQPFATPAITARMVARQLVELLAAYCVQGVEERPREYAAELLGSRYSHVLGLMRKYCSDPKLKPETIAARADLSRASLFRLFKAQGTRFSAELTRIRLERARDVLDTPGDQSMNLTELAMNCGFADSSSFSRQFRNMFCQTPSVYRQRRQQRETELQN